MRIFLFTYYSSLYELIQQAGPILFVASVNNFKSSDLCMYPRINTENSIMLSCCIYVPYDFYN